MDFDFNYDQQFLVNYKQDYICLQMPITNYKYGSENYRPI